MVKLRRRWTVKNWDEEVIGSGGDVGDQCRGVEGEGVGLGDVEEDGETQFFLRDRVFGVDRSPPLRVPKESNQDWQWPSDLGPGQCHGLKRAWKNVEVPDQVWSFLVFELYCFTFALRRALPLDMGAGIGAGIGAAAAASSVLDSGAAADFVFGFSASTISRTDFPWPFLYAIYL